MDDLWYTVVDSTVDEESEEGNEVVLGFFPDPDGIVLEFDETMGNSFHIDNQQLGELGHLLIALSRGEYDKSSVPELLEGYGIKPQS